MAIVLLHGVPETPIVWEPLVAALERNDLFTAQLPGFGCPVPQGFSATKDEYVDWFVTVLEHQVAQRGPIDLVGHDWGSGIGLRAASLRPDLIRSWACDALGLFHADFEWHDFAKIWQTPGAGEDYFRQNLASPIADRVALYEMIGIPRSTGERLVAASDETMTDCILRLYRSAQGDMLADWVEQVGHAATRPGLAIIAPDDPFVTHGHLAGEVADRLGASRHELAGQGHWWMLSDPAAGAALLKSFWSEAY